MFHRVQKNGLLYITLTLLFFVIFLFYFDFKSDPKYLTFAMLDVGQGDALFVESPSGVQILIDGGPPNKILSQLSRVMSPVDRYIDALIITNPDADHISGFLEVLKNYDVGLVLEPGTLNDSKTFQNLKDEIKNKNITDLFARRGMRLDMGEGVYLDILFPDRDVSDWTPNDGSVVGRLSYGDTSIMLTGDSTIKTENIILASNTAADLKSAILKAGHHGSRTSSGDAFVRVVAPSYALISDGKDNKYGHPHQETLDTFRAFGVEVLRTDLLGAIIMKSDGLKETFSFHK